LFYDSFNSDLKRVEDGINEKLGLAIHYLSATVIDLVTAFIYGWKLTLVVLALTPVLAASTAVMTKV
jgi:ATP-binding cassette subfamily B (MDR/TAP) protein 1